MDNIKEKIQPGTRVRLLKMDDFQAPPVGTEGTVAFIDDIGTIHVKWETGSTLGLIGTDEFKVLGGED